VKSLLTSVLLLLLAAGSFTRPCLAGEVESVQEAARVLEEEIKLAARPNLYLVLDLGEGMLFLKGRGLELYRFPLLDWHTPDETQLGRLFTLRARPPVSRPKAVPGRDPVELRHMPVQYDLLFDPPLLVLVAPSASERPWLWARNLLREWRARGLGFGGAKTLADPEASPTLLRLTLSQETAQSLAWSLTDGMALLIKRP
jgi:hypothetical protein